MKRKILLIWLGIMVISIQSICSAEQIPIMPSQNAPPIVNAIDVKINSSIFSIDGALWASVDAEYRLHTIHAFGENFIVQHLGRINISSNRLEAHYPIPLNAKNVSIKVNNEEKDWQIDNKSICQIFDLNLPEAKWTINPVPHDFTITVHYDQPIPNTRESTLYLGQYVQVFPFILRFGSTDTPQYPLYSWFEYGTSEALFRVQIQPYINQLKPYLIDYQGSLPTINSSTYVAGNTLEIRLSLNYAEMPIQGIVLTMNAELYQKQRTESVLFISIVGTVTILIIILLIYRRKSLNNRFAK